MNTALRSQQANHGRFSPLRGSGSVLGASRLWASVAAPLLALCLLIAPVLAAAEPPVRPAESPSAAMWQGVLKDQQAVLQTHGDVPESLFWLAVASANLGRLEDSRQAFLRLDKVDPRRISSRSVETQCRDILATDPHNIKALNGVAFLAYAREAYGEAAAGFQDVVRLEPRNPWPRSYWGFSLGKAGRLPEAIRVLEEGVKLFPDNEVLHFLLGLAYYHRGSLVKALLELSKAPRAVQYFR